MSCLDRQHRVLDRDPRVAVFYRIDDVACASRAAAATVRLPRVDVYGVQIGGSIGPHGERSNVSYADELTIRASRAEGDRDIRRKCAHQG